jgi:hypothetical protein
MLHWMHPNVGYLDMLGWLVEWRDIEDLQGGLNEFCPLIRCR